MTSSRPYLIRALYEWLNDNKLTPYILVDAKYQGVSVPKDYITDGKIVLNLAPDAIHNLIVMNSELEFHASFAGNSYHIIVPIMAVLAIYASENGQGMVFGQEPGGETPPNDSKYRTKKDQSAKKPFLKVIK